MMAHWLSKDEWNQLAEGAHMVCFNERRPKDFNTFDFAILVDDETGPLTYATCIEMDKESVYMQHGGAFPLAAKTIKTKRAYSLILSELKSKFKRASTRIQNTNIAMLKLAMSEGFLINGIDNFKSEIFCHLQNEFRGN